MDDKLRSALKDICLSEDKGALVTIIKVLGSAPRKEGAKMLVLPDGQTFGTIGGGCAEAAVKMASLHALDRLKPVKYTMNMTQELAEDEGMACGGVMDILIDILPPGNNKEKEYMRNYLSALANKEEPVQYTVIEPTTDPIDLPGKFFVTSSGKVISNVKDGQILSLWMERYKPNGQPRLEKDGKFEIFIEPAPAIVELVVLGGGHIALPLCEMAKILGYYVTVVDDRPLFANRDRFKSADQVICKDFLQAIKGITFSEKTYVVIVTRGHRHDKVCLKAVLKQPSGYIGMIGSKRRVKALMGEIMDEGITAKTVANIHSPIGIDIGAQTPEEIAVSILAEVIQVHRNG
jgi:xanthine dehydrogenase accessory factor